MSTWASDTKPSMPAPVQSDNPIRVPFKGFGFTAGGIAHDISEVEVERRSIPTFAPIDWAVDGEGL